MFRIVQRQRPEAVGSAIGIAVAVDCLIWAKSPGSASKVTERRSGADCDRGTATAGGGGHMYVLDGGMPDFISAS